MLEDRFWKKVNKNGPLHPVLGTPCWLWTGATTSRSRTGGYGGFYVGKKKIVGAHVFSLSLKLGRPVEGWALHKCDQSLCVNYDHLYEGDRKDNARDLVDRDLQPRGEKNGRARFTDAQVLDIRERCARGERNVDIAVLYETTADYIGKIKRQTRRSDRGKR